MCHGNWTGPNCETKIVKDEVCNATDVNAMSHKYTTIFLVNEPFFFEPIFLIKLTLTLFFTHFRKSILKMMKTYLFGIIYCYFFFSFLVLELL